HLWRIGLQPGAQPRVLRERQRLERSGFASVHHAACSIYIHTAGGNHTPGDATHGVHQYLGLCARAEDQINYDLGSKATNLCSVHSELVSVSQNVSNAGGKGRRAVSPMKYSDGVSQPL